MRGLQPVTGARSRPSRDTTSRIPRLATGCTSVIDPGLCWVTPGPGPGAVCWAPLDLIRVPDRASPLVGL